MSWPITISPPSRTTNRAKVRDAVDEMLGDDDISGGTVVVDWSDRDAITPSAADETLLAITSHGHDVLVTVRVGTIDAAELLNRTVIHRLYDNVEVRIVAPEQTADPLDRPVTAKDLRDMLATLSEAYLKLEEARYSTLANLAGKFDERLTQILHQLVDIETAIRDTRQ